MPRDKPLFDVGLIVPLGEEFDYVIEVAPIRSTFVHDGRHFYELEFGSRSVVACIAGDMGPLPAQHATIDLLSFAEVHLIAVIGVAGALTSDVSLGDVVVGESINEFQANSKAVADGRSYETHYSGRHWTLPWAIREAVSNFRFAARRSYELWLEESHRSHVECFAPQGSSSDRQPRYHIGRVASGNVVSAAAAFVQELRGIDRKFVAIEMEAAGAAGAAQGRVHPVPCIVVRGISDQSDETKSATDVAPSGSWRRYAVRNAATLMRALLAWDDFCAAAGMATPSEPSASPPLIDLLNSLRSEVGARWVLGVAVGVLTHVPRDLPQNGVADIGTERVDDPALDSWLTDVTTTFNEFLLTGAVDQTTAHIRALIRMFRATHSGEAIDDQLRNFDEVAERALNAGTDDPSGYLLVEADRVEEDAGRVAAIEFLQPFASKPMVRARVVALTADERMWARIEEILSAVPLTDLARSECENLIEARLKLGADVSELIDYHSKHYDDIAARLFRRHCIP